MPSEPVLSPGNVYAGAGAIDYASPERVAEATLQVALADVTATTGQPALERGRAPGRVG